MLLQSLLVTLTTMAKWGWRRLTQLGTVQPSHVRSSACATQQLDTVDPCSVISSMLAWIHRYATLCNTLFSMMWRISQKCKQNFEGDLSTIATLMFAVLHVLLNSSSHEYTEHPWKVYDIFNGAQHCLLKSCQMKHKQGWIHVAPWGGHAPPPQILNFLNSIYSKNI